MDTKEMKLIIRSGMDIVYEDASIFKQSVHREAYKKAYQITDTIIRQNAKFEEYQNSSGAGRSYGTDLRNLKQMGNVLFFSGERGAGKTSAMLSYMEFLKDYYRNSTSLESEKIIGELGFSEKNLMFTGLEYIDASRLADKEDILGSVLAKMAKKWMSEEKKGLTEGGLRKSRDYEYKKRQLQMQFNEIYKCLSALKTKKEIFDQEDDMYFDTLQKLSFTENLKDSFEKLVEMYVDIMQYANASETKHYLVIPIDDLDMNIKNGYEQLEQIRKYLMIPKVIVLISANYDQLEKICYNHYKVEFSHLKKANNYIQKLTREYLEKLVPNEHQIWLRSGKRWSHLRNTVIEYENYDEFNRAVSQKLQGDTVVETIRLLLKNKFRIRMGIGSRALQYLIPATLRELSAWLNAVVPLSDYEEASLEQYEQNMKVFWSELFPLLLRSYLSENEKSRVNRLMDRDAFAQKKWLKTYIENQEIEERIFYPSQYRRKKQSIYVEESIVELLWILHNKVDKNEAMYNILVIYFTAKISELIGYVEGAKENDSLAEKSLKELKHYYQGGLFGKSESEMTADLMRTSILFKDKKQENEEKISNNSIDTKAEQLSRLGERALEDSDKTKENQTAQMYSEYAYQLIGANTDSLHPDFIKMEKLKNDKPEAGLKNMVESPKFKFYCEKLLFYTFVPKQSIHYEIAQDIPVKFTNERDGIFSLSGAFVYQIIGSDIREVFLDEIEKYYRNNSEKIEEMISGIRICPLGKNLIQDFPIDSMEYLIDIGDWMRDRKESVIRVSGLEDNISLNKDIEKVFQRYYKQWSLCFEELDKKYQTNYAESYWQGELCSQMKDGKIASINDLALQMVKEIDWEIRAPKLPDKAWGNE
jgi:hypothetical protein